MAVKVTSREYRHCDLVVVDGRIDSSTAIILAMKLQQIMEEGRFRFVVSLEEVDFFSSAGIRELISATKKCRLYNRGDVRLVMASSKVRKAFELSGFVDYWKVYDHLEDAVGSF